VSTWSGNSPAGGTSLGEGGTTTAHPDRLEVHTSTGPVDPTGGKINAATDVSSVSVGQLVGEILADVSGLMRKEIELAKAEIREEATKAGKGVGMLGGAGVAGYFTLVFLSLTLMFALDAWFMATWVAALTITVLWGIGAAVLGLKGRNKLREVKPVPEQTVESVKEDVQWAKGAGK